MWEALFSRNSNTTNMSDDCNQWFLQRDDVENGGGVGNQQVTKVFALAGGLTESETQAIRQGYGVQNLVDLLVLQSADFDSVFGGNSNNGRQRRLVQRRLEIILAEIRCHGWNDVMARTDIEFFLNRRLAHFQRSTSPHGMRVQIPVIFHIVAWMMFLQMIVFWFVAMT